jgi:hypothetical protein
MILKVCTYFNKTNQANPIKNEIIMNNKNNWQITFTDVCSDVSHDFHVSLIK